MMHKAFEAMEDINTREPHADHPRALEKIPPQKTIKCDGAVIGFGAMTGWVWLPSAGNFFTADQKRLVEAACEE